MEVVVRHSTLNLYTITIAEWGHQIIISNPSPKKLNIKKKQRAAVYAHSTRLRKKK